MSRKTDQMIWEGLQVFSCKFSKNKNNMDVFGWSTGHGDIYVQTTGDSSKKAIINRHSPHRALTRIHDLAWAEPQMKLVTASTDNTSKICSVTPSGSLEIENIFDFTSQVKSVMFCPGSSDVFCGGSTNETIQIWDARDKTNHYANSFRHRKIRDFNMCIYPSSYIFSNYGVSSVIFKDDRTVLSCSYDSPYIYEWDLRKTHGINSLRTMPSPVMTYAVGEESTRGVFGFTDMIMNQQSTHIYASRLDPAAPPAIFCFSLDSAETSPVRKYDGHKYSSPFVKISISYDGQYLLSGSGCEPGVIWSTNNPYIKYPVFISRTLEGYISSPYMCSAWCIDPSILVTCSKYEIPVVWTIDKENNVKVISRFSAVPTYASKQTVWNKIHTLPIRLNPELKKECLRETEENMKSWFLEEEDQMSTKERNTNMTTGVSEI